MLQFVHAHDALRRDSGNLTSPLSVGDLCRLCELFDYPKKLTSELAQEFAEYECFQLRGSDYPMAEAMHRFEIEPMPKMRALLDRFIFDIGYLNLAAMRVPLALESFGYGPSFITAATLDEEGSSVFADWVCAKLLNPISVFRFLNAANQKQETSFNRNIGALSERLQRTAHLTRSMGMFDFTNKMRRDLEQQIKQVLGSLESGHLQSRELFENVGRRIESYARVWA